MQGEWVTVARELEARLVPVGTAIRIPEGSNVMITQAMGGSFTVMIDGNLAMIDGNDSDALGKEPITFEFEDVDPDGKVNSDHIRQVLKTCFDPEIPVNIMDLGLIYECEITERATGDNLVNIKMTLTAPGCGMGPMLADEVKQKLLKVPNITDVEVELTFDPPWNQSMLSEAAKLELGLM